MSKSVIQVLELREGQAVVSTENVFRVIVHCASGEDEYRELQPIEEAIAYVESYNCIGGAKTWAEIISYDEARRRDDRERLDEEIREGIDRGLKRAAEQRQPSAVKRLAARAAALIW